MKNLKSEKGFADLLVIVVVVVVLVAGVGYYVLNRQKSKTSSNLQSTPTAKVTHPGVIQSEVFASSIDAASAPVKTATTFSPTEPKIYVAVGLKNAKTTQRVEYTRYLNGKFVDNGSIPLTKDGANYASFGFVLNTGKTHPKGTYLVKTYTNGIFERSATYKVQ